MLRPCSGVAALALILTTAAPASAREPAKSRSDRAKARASAPQSVGTANIALSGIGRTARQRDGALSPAGDFATGMLRQEGPPDSRNSILRSMPMGPVEAGVGLFSVTGATVRERELRRTDPIGDVAPRRSRVAAVGLRMSF